MSSYVHHVGKLGMLTCVKMNAMTRNIITPNICYLGQMSVARQEAFDNFKRTYRHNQTIQEQKQALKERYLSISLLIIVLTDLLMYKNFFPYNILPSHFEIYFLVK